MARRRKQLLRVTPPGQAPALWKDRIRGTSAAEFVLAHYKQYFGRRGHTIGMTMSDLRVLDPLLHRDLWNWFKIRKSKSDPAYKRIREGLPTHHERERWILEALLSGQGVPDLTHRTLHNLVSIALRKK